MDARTRAMTADRGPETGAGEHGDLPATPGAAARESAHAHDDEGVDEASDESFPASDPPASTHTHAGPPHPHTPNPRTP
jgi:hypothetical protein